jgi:hypothetical protein
MITIDNKFEIGQKVYFNFDFETRFSFLNFDICDITKVNEKFAELGTIQKHCYGIIKTIATDGEETIYNVSCCFEKDVFDDYQLYGTIFCFENELKDMGE